jgi:hypothetical protein
MLNDADHSLSQRAFVARGGSSSWTSDENGRIGPQLVRTPHAMRFFPVRSHRRVPGLATSRRSAPAAGTPTVVEGSIESAACSRICRGHRRRVVGSCVDKHARDTAFRIVSASAQPE